ncbi:hypothetical protein LTH96_12085 [Nesterenkonia sp. LB17]|uniref:hypothetical protein n=2 Tax=unclassified Nesterenkonia TaxID=2629769 RepID=UPI001F4C754A|nr:hypothetical protein [Nesterenkonia sp. LB17]MCH8566454.1 hypothetical protein [Nesterenkonia sp. LB17]
MVEGVIHMRQVLSVISLLLAAVLAGSALAGFQADQLLREDEPIRQIAGELPQQEGFSELVSETLLDQMESELPGGLANLLGDRADSAVDSIVASMLENEEIDAAWDETLQGTRVDYAAQLETMFDQGTTGQSSDLDLAVDLSPMAEAMTGPLREGLDSALGWLPFLDTASFEFLAPEVVVDIEATTGEGADPYTWALLAEVSRHWLVLAVLAGVMVAVGLLLGPGRSRWVALALGGLLGVGLGLGIALTVAAAEFGAVTDAATQSLVDHLEVQITAWAQPAWWVFSGAAGAAVVVGLLGSVAARSSRRVTSPRGLDR